MIAWCAVAALGAPVVEPLGDGVVLDWTRSEVRIGATAQGDPSASTRAADETARRQAEASIRAAIPSLRVDCTSALGDLLASERFGPALEARVAAWEIRSATYDLAGRVRLEGALSVVDLLRPVAHAQPAEPVAGPEPAYTGVVIDARGSAATPTWFPRVVGDDGALLWNGRLLEEPALSEAPAVWVRDISEPEAARAGGSPIVLRAGASSGCSLALDAADTVRWRTALGTAVLPLRGRVVVLVDGP